MNHAEFACAGGIQDLSFGEVDLVGGADFAGDVRDTMTWVGLGAAAVAAGAAMAAPPTAGASAPVAAGAGIVAGAAMVVAGVAGLMSDD
ncbi:hypothetical protein DL238_00240 [Alteriqipengyuania lutimaris]|uniref:Uncharacterized protein n=2 Tax=Alteriqipengyuania lutimaris TaxID=1538146 RepID=A0A395LHT1_9SPHN|nr:hypothetical protein DL238_00240 [Alteriqipengyuania lutimaris]